MVGAVHHVRKLLRLLQDLMKSRISKQELFLLGLAFALGLFLRFRHTELLAVEHFDEGVYTAGLWHDAAVGEPYPMRHLYAPPLLPKLIELCALVPGLSDVAPFLPSIVLGAFSVPLVWWLARVCFGMTAGLFAAFVFALSDFHILFSRMALTDVPVLFWMLAAVGTAVRGIADSSVRKMSLAGLFTGIAWWTKYTGWLPLAIISSGAGFWWLLRGRSEMNLSRLLLLQAVSVATALTVWLPWYWMLQADGGYSAVAANHAGYFSGLSAWREHLASHVMYHFQFDSWVGAAALLLGMATGATRRWMDLARFTWNAGDASIAVKQSHGTERFPAITILLRFLFAAIALGVVSSGVSCAGLLTCLAIGGLAGMFLWPVLNVLHCRAADQATVADVPGGHSYTAADFAAAPRIDPLIGACFVTAWFVGMILTTPMYQPFPRLSLPLFASIVLAASGGIAWWMEATLNVARRRESSKTSVGAAFTRKLVGGLVVVALAISITTSGGVRPPTFWQNRTSLRDAAWHVADTVLHDAKGDPAPVPAASNSTELEIISPAAAQETVASIQQLQALICDPFDVTQPLADIRRPECVVYGFGEPAVIGHINAAGVIARPIQDLGFGPARYDGKKLPTYLLFGPNALRTPHFLNEWTAEQYRFTQVTDIHFAPSQAVLFNLFTPQWVASHLESHVQKLELYRLN